MIDPGMGDVSLLRAAFAFVVVFALLALMGFALKYVKMRGFTMPGTAARAKRLELVETLMLDVRRRLVIVRRDGIEHLLLLGINQDIVVEANLNKNAADLQTKNGA